MVSNAGVAPPAELAGGSPDELLSCLLIVAKAHGLPSTAEAVMAGLPADNHRLTPSLFARAARRAHMSSRLVREPLAQYPMGGGYCGDMGYWFCYPEGRTQLHALQCFRQWLLQAGGPDGLSLIDFWSLDDDLGMSVRPQTFVDGQEFVRNQHGGERHILALLR